MGIIKSKANKLIFFKTAAALLLLMMSLLPQNLTAGQGRISFVETVVDLRENGAAVVGYTVQWQVLSGELHGFYFEGNDRLKVGMIPADSYAVDGLEMKYKLDISYVSGGKWDIVLANGQGVGQGTVTYVFFFKTDFTKAPRGSELGYPGEASGSKVGLA